MIGLADAVVLSLGIGKSLFVSVGVEDDADIILSQLLLIEDVIACY